MSNPERRPRRLDAVVINDDLEVPSLLNAADGKIFLTNKVGLHVIKAANGEHTVGQIVASVVDRFEGTEEQVVAKEVEAFLEEGINRSLLAWA